MLPPLNQRSRLSDNLGFAPKVEVQAPQSKHSGSSSSSVNSAGDKAIESDTLTVNVIILSHSNSEILLVHDGHHFVLPVVMIPKWRRVVQEITERILRLWNLRTIYLFQPEIPGNAREDVDHYVVLETRDSAWDPPAGFSWVSREGLRNRFHSTKEACSVEEVLATADAHMGGSLGGLFTRAGWFDDLTLWAQEKLDPHRLKLTGNFRQLNGGPSFSLIRLETTGPAVWFKAVGQPNLHEFSITTTLARHFPSYLPTLIATQPSWNGWLTFEAEGSMLDEKSDIGTWEKAARSLASLQIESVTKTPELLDAGCRDIRMPALLDQIEPFFEVMAELMRKQPRVPPPMISGQELRALAVRLKEAFSCLGELGLADTLGHLDFNPGNIIAAPTGCVFLDWAEAYVGHPFFTFEYLREHLSRTNSGNVAWESKVTAWYIEPWASLMSVKGISQALDLAPLVAVFAYAIGSNTWRDLQRLENPKVAGYFRSLTRRMQREVNLLENRRARCLG